MIIKQYYDIIGDIHGHADALEALLDKLSYALVDGVYQHEINKVIFLGDFIDRGLQQREVIDIVKPMIEQGFALSVMGNHEFNAICYATNGSDGKVLRAHSDKNTEQHQAFLDAYPIATERNEIIDWFKTLPVYIEVDGIRVIHASWNENALVEIASLLNDKQCLLDDAYEACSEKDSNAYLAIETLLKGPEADLPEGVSFKDKGDTKRYAARVKWWADKSSAIKDRLHIGDKVENLHNIDQTIINDSHHYHPDHPPVFVGHYWLNDNVPSPVADNCACLDYSIAKNGKLVAYCWRGEKILKESNFVWDDNIK